MTSNWQALVGLIARTCLGCACDPGGSLSMTKNGLAERQEGATSSVRVPHEAGGSVTSQRRGVFDQILAD